MCFAEWLGSVVAGSVVGVWEANKLMPKSRQCEFLFYVMKMLTGQDSDQLVK